MRQTRVEDIKKETMSYLVWRAVNQIEGRMQKLLEKEYDDLIAIKEEPPKRNSHSKEKKKIENAKKVYRVYYDRLY